MFKIKSIDEIYNTLSDDLKDVNFDLVTLFEIFKVLINSIILIKKLSNMDMIKKSVLFFVLEKVIEQNIPQDYILAIKSIVKLLKVKYFDIFLALLKFILYQILLYACYNVYRFVASSFFFFCYSPICLFISFCFYCGGAKIKDTETDTDLILKKNAIAVVKKKDNS